MLIESHLSVEIPVHRNERGNVDSWTVPIIQTVIRERRSSVEEGTLHAWTESSEPGQEWIEVVW